VAADSYNKISFLSLLSLTWRDNKRGGMHVSLLSPGCHKFVIALVNSYFFFATVKPVLCDLPREQ
jgi:hypothetical protein